LFERGYYNRALQCLKNAMEIQPPLTKLGGDIQIYLAFTLDAMGKTKDACKILRIIEDTHPSRKMIKQAEEIRFVLEAPKLEIEQRDLNFGFQANSDRYRPRERRMRKPSKPKYKENANASPVTLADEEPETTLPEWMRNPTIIIIITAGVGAAAWQSAVMTAAQRATGN